MYTKEELIDFEKHLKEYKKNLIASNFTSKYQLETNKKYFEDKLKDLRAQRFDKLVKQAATVTSTALLEAVMLWFISLPWYLQVGIGAVILVAAIVVLYLIEKSSDPAGNLKRLIGLLEELLQILGNIPIPDPTPLPPVASFTATPLSGQAPLTVIVADTSTGATSIGYKFGDEDI